MEEVEDSIWQDWQNLGYEDWERVDISWSSLLCLDCDLFGSCDGVIVEIGWIWEGFSNEIW